MNRDSKALLERASAEGFKQRAERLATEQQVAPLSVLGTPSSVSDTPSCVSDTLNSVLDTPGSVVRTPGDAVYTPGRQPRASSSAPSASPPSRRLRALRANDSLRL